jgi:Tn3 transposase DDE domain
LRGPETALIEQPDGIVAAAVDRLGRNVVDCLNRGCKMRDGGKLLATYGHDGPWDLDDPADENQFIEARGAQTLHSLQSALDHVDTLLMQQAFAHPEWAGTVTDADRRALSALFRTHVNMAGSSWTWANGPAS